MEYPNGQGRLFINYREGGAKLDFVNLGVIARPFPHVSASNYVEPILYERLRETFPECRGDPGQLQNLFPDDEEYCAHIDKHPAWAEFIAGFHTESFAKYCLNQFSDVWAAEGCVIDPKLAQITSFHEPRDVKSLRHLPVPLINSHELFVRLDFMQGRPGYSLPIHTDHRRRLMTMLIYFSDADDSAMEGGDLILYGSKAGEVGDPEAAIRPQGNFMIAFPSTGRSFHSVAPIQATRGPRNVVQVQLSSTVDAWRPAAAE